MAVHATTLGDSINSKHLKGILPLHSDPVLSEDEQKAKKGAAFGEMGPWLKRHTDDVVKPLFTKVTEALKKDSKTLGKNTKISSLDRLSLAYATIVRSSQVLSGSAGAVAMQSGWEELDLNLSKFFRNAPELPMWI